MSKINKAMVLAAGYGKRARPLSLIRPKPMFPVLNRPMISYTLERLSAAGIVAAAVNIHHLADKLEGCLADIDALNIHPFREDVLLGTGGGIKNAERFFDSEPFLVVNSDIMTDIDLQGVMADHLTNRPAATLVLHDYPVFNQVFVDNGGLILGFRGKVEDAGRTEGERKLAFTGIHVIEPWILECIPAGPYDIIDVYQSLIDRGSPVRAYIVENPFWWDAGTLESYLALHADLINGPDKVVKSESAVIEPGAMVEGWACLGQGAIVESGGIVKNSVLWPGARVAGGATVRDSVLADFTTAAKDLTGTAFIKS